MRAILHNIRSVYNVASIFRTADGASVKKLYLSGYTPAPIDRFGRSREKFQKVALGAENLVQYEKNQDVKALIRELQAEGVVVVACEPTEKAVDYRKHKPAGEACFVFGNEPDGLPEEIIAACDKAVKIPMCGEKTSLNVSVAFGVIMYSFLT